MFTTAGNGYSIQLLVYDDEFRSTGSVSIGSIEVRVGPMYQLDFIYNIGKAVGGEVFTPNPAIKIVDRGYNTISSLMYGYINAWLCLSPSSDGKLMSKTILTATIVSGIGAFTGLYINTAGHSYALCFNTTIEVSEIETEN